MHNPTATSTQPIATTIFHQGFNSPNPSWPFSRRTPSLTSCCISATSIKTPIVTNTVAQTISLRSASLNGIRALLRRYNSSTDLDERSVGINGGLETRNQRELRIFSIYMLVWVEIHPQGHSSPSGVPRFDQPKITGCLKPGAPGRVFEPARILMQPAATLSQSLAEAPRPYFPPTAVSC